MKHTVKKILVVTLSNIGDIILTTPVVENLIEKFPDAKIDILVGKKGKELFGKYRNVENVIIYDKKKSLWSKFILCLELRKQRYDVGIDLRNTLIPLIAGAKVRTGIFRKNKGEGHRRDLHLSRLGDVGIDVSKNDGHIPVTENDKKRAEDMLVPLGGRPYVVMSPGAKSHVKRWSLKNFAKLGDILNKELGYEVVLIGDESDRVVIERTLFYMKTRPLNLIEKTNIRELAHIIGKSRLLITNDSAPLHMGSSVNAPILVFFGPTDERKYGPFTKKPSRVLRNKMDCSPCEAPQCINRENKYGCLKGVSVEEAVGVVKELLGEVKR